MDSVRPDKCVEMLKFLKTHNSHYRKVVFNDDWIHERFLALVKQKISRL